jgi:hypothetical protein
VPSLDPGAKCLSLCNDIASSTFPSVFIIFIADIPAEIFIKKFSFSLHPSLVFVQSISMLENDEKKNSSQQFFHKYGCSFGGIGR